MPIIRNTGINASERYLARHCEASFLSMWSYPNVYSDKGKTTSTGCGVEICDLLVLCGDDLIIFSDKHCRIKDSGDLRVDWRRWFKRAVENSVRQIYGAERWLRDFPNRVFIDPGCKQVFPFSLSEFSQFRVHRIAVARGAGDRCRKEIGGSGSMVIYPSCHHKRADQTEMRSQPFYIDEWGTHNGFVHVLDDVTLDILLRELDTITDFTSYLTKKENMIANGRLAYAMGEENMLAVYLKEMNEYEEHDFVIPEGSVSIAVGDGIWNHYINNSQYQAKKKANEQSYLWDMLIEEFSIHAMEGTLIEGSSSSILDTERGLRVMAREDRLSRRMLSKAIWDFMSTAPVDRVATRPMYSSNLEGTAYVFLTVPAGDVNDISRLSRRSSIQEYCYALAWKHKTFDQVIGIATESGIKTVPRSHDLLYVKIDEWTPEMEELARTIIKRRNILSDDPSRIRSMHVDEYPE